MSEHARKLIDCFLFSNEVDILLYHLTVLNDVIDTFVLVEAPLTFVGNEKPLFFEEYCTNASFQPFLNKIVHLKAQKESFPCPTPSIHQNEQWKNEYFQRDMLQEIVPSLRDTDIILLSDVDEIYDRTTLQKLRDTINDETLYAFEQKYHCYNLNTVRVLNWYHAKAFTVDMWKTVLKQLPFSSIRLKGVTEPYDLGAFVCVSQGGWHLSYFGSVDFIVHKLQNFSHQEFNNEYIINTERIKHRIENGRDIMERDDIQFQRIPICRNMYLPTHYDSLLSSFILY